MKACCKGGGRRHVRLASWLVPGSLLVLMPKCPACFAGYVALFTGVGISLPVATGLRRALIACIVVVLVLMFIAFLRRRWR